MRAEKRVYPVGTVIDICTVEIVNYRRKNESGGHALCTARAKCSKVHGLSLAKGMLFSLACHGGRGKWDRVTSFLIANLCNNLLRLNTDEV